MTPPLTILRGPEIYAPDAVGPADIVIIGEQIALIGDAGDLPPSWRAHAVHLDAAGLHCTPGFVDHHTHFAGGGGMGGYTTRPPVLPLSRFVRAGVTTVVGCPGADSVTRSPMDLLASARQLRMEGLTTYVLIGGTGEHPVQPLTGEIKRDIILIPEVLGVGEISISDLGASVDSLQDLPHYVFQVAVQAQIAGRLSGKRGVVLLQVPTGGRGLQPLLDGLSRVQIPASHFIPSHANSHPGYLEQAVEFVRRGGYLDIGTTHTPTYGFRDGIEPAPAVRTVMGAGVPVQRLVISSDANGVSGRHYLPIETLPGAFTGLVREVGLPIADALRPLTINPAELLGLPTKGRIAVGADADLLLFDPDLTIRAVVARGRVMMREGEMQVFGTWERRP